LLDAENGEWQGQLCSLFHQRHEFVELRTGLLAGECDADGMEEFLAFGAGGFLDVFDPGVEDFRGDRAAVGSDAAGELTKHGTGGVGGEDGRVLRIGMRRVGIEAEDEGGFDGKLGQVIDSVQNNKVVTWYNGINSMVLAIQRQPGTDTIEVVDRDRTMEVKRDQIELVDRNKNSTVKGDYSTDIQGQLSLNARKDINEKAAGTFILQAGGDIHLKAGGRIVLEAANGVTFIGAQGSSFIDCTQAGVTLQGPKVWVNCGLPMPAGALSATPTPPNLPALPGTVDLSSVSTVPNLANPSPASSSTPSSTANTGNQASTSAAGSTGSGAGTGSQDSMSAVASLAAGAIAVNPGSTAGTGSTGTGPGTASSGTISSAASLAAGASTANPGSTSGAASTGTAAGSSAPQTGSASIAQNASVAAKLASNPWVVPESQAGAGALDPDSANTTPDTLAPTIEQIDGEES